MGLLSEYLTTEYVCGRLASFGVDEATVGKVFAARMEPESLDDKGEPIPDYVHDFDKKFVLGVPVPGRKAVLLVYRFGLGEPLVKKTPLDEGGPDWRPRWMSIEGPFPLEQVAGEAAELTSG